MMIACTQNTDRKILEVGVEQVVSKRRGRTTVGSGSGAAAFCLV